MKGVTAALVLLLEDGLTYVLQPDGVLQLKGFKNMADLGPAANGVAFAWLVGAWSTGECDEAAIKAVKAAVERKADVTPAHTRIRRGGEASAIGCRSFIARGCFCLLAAWGSPTTLASVIPEGFSIDVIAARSGDLLNVPAASVGGAVGLHQVDSGLAVCASLFAGFDQAPEDVAIKGVTLRLDATRDGV